MGWRVHAFARDLEWRGRSVSAYSNKLGQRFACATKHWPMKNVNKASFNEEKLTPSTSIQASFLHPTSLLCLSLSLSLSLFLVVFHSLFGCLAWPRQFSRRARLPLPCDSADDRGLKVLARGFLLIEREWAKERKSGDPRGEARISLICISPEPRRKRFLEICRGILVNLSHFYLCLYLLERSSLCRTDALGSSVGSPLASRPSLQ